MAHLRELMAAGVPATVARMLGSNLIASFPAAGVDQASATPLSRNFAILTNNGATTQGVRVGSATGAGISVYYNAGPSALTLYPDEGDAFQDLQPNTGMPVQVSSTIVMVPSNDAWLVSATAPPGVTQTPGGTGGQIQINAGGNFGGITFGGDATCNTGTGIITVQGLQGRALASTQPLDRQTLAWSASAQAWQPVQPSGAVGPQGENAFTNSLGNFTVPAVGSSVTVSVAQTDWIVPGQFLYVDTAGGGAGIAGLFLATSKTPSSVTLQTPAAPQGGTITGVTAGTGLTGGGTVGTVTLALTTPVSVANGGTGATTAAGAPWIPTAGGTATGAITINLNAAAPPAYQFTPELNVVGANGTSPVMYLDAFGSGALPLLRGRSAQGTAAAPTASQQYNTLMYIGGVGRGATSYSVHPPYISLTAAENFTDTAQGSQINLSTTLLGTTTEVISLALQGNAANFATNGNVNMGDLSLSQSAAWTSLNLYSAVGQRNLILGNNGGNARWEIDLGNGTAESGTSTGNDFAVSRFTNAGAYIDTPLTIARANANATFSSSLASNYGAMPADAAQGIFTANNYYGYSSTALVCGLYYTTGAQWKYVQNSSGGLIGGVTSGGWNFYTAPSGTAGAVAPLNNVVQIYLNGTIQVNDISVGIDQNTFIGQTATNSDNFFRWVGARTWGAGIKNSGDPTIPGGYLIADYNAGTQRLNISASGACTCSSSWGAISDGRLKTAIAENKRGLADILQVQPRQYRYTGEYGFEGDGTGFVAQELAEIMPELVRPGLSSTDGTETYLSVVETGLLGPLVNAVKELAAANAQLEARLAVLEGGGRAGP